ncbi:hypothetical protein HAX54_013942 [Datura stramonium]|uniref:Uncharacterized protein n=1 Tax=Datura stramonium TaxID=4076 RepID=A0ABS8TPS0_DATST|nr:hypothetical protein [Datura stramonium]
MVRNRRRSGRGSMRLSGGFPVGSKVRVKEIRWSSEFMQRGVRVEGKRSGRRGCDGCCLDGREGGRREMRKEKDDGGYGVFRRTVVASGGERGR